MAAEKLPSNDQMPNFTPKRNISKPVDIAWTESLIDSHTTSTTKNKANAPNKRTKLVKRLTDALKSNKASHQGDNHVQASQASASESIVKPNDNTKATRIETDNTDDDTKSNKIVPTLKEKQEEAWKLIHERHNQRTSLVDHFNNLRKPGSLEPGFRSLSPGAKNRSDAYHRFLQRGAFSKVNATIGNWREIICQNSCCKDKSCTENCCTDKSDKKLTTATWNAKHKHLYASLRALGEEVSQWQVGVNHKHTDIVGAAMKDITSEEDWLEDEKIMARNWEQSFEWVKEQIEEDLESMGTSLKEIEWAEENLKEVEMKEMARIEEQERLEAEKSSAIIDDATESDIGSDGELDGPEDDGECPHLYTNIPAPPRSPMEVPIEEYRATDWSKALFQLLNGPMTPPLTPIIEGDEPATSISDFFNQDDIEYLEAGQSFEIAKPTDIKENNELRLINALITDLGEEFMNYRNITDKHFGDDFWYVANPEPEQMSQHNTCSWRLHHISDSVKDVLSEATQIPPDLRVTDPEGNVYTLEEVTPIMDEYFVNHVAEREAFQEEQEDYLYQSGQETDGQFYARQEHLKQWEDEFRQKDELLAMKDNLAEPEAANQMEEEIDFEEGATRDQTPQPIEDNTSDDNNNDTETAIPSDEKQQLTDLESARRLVNNFDKLLRTLLVETKLEFRSIIHARSNAEYAAQDKGKYLTEKANTAVRFESTLRSLRRKLKKEGMVSKDGKEWWTAMGSGHEVEIKGRLVRDWEAMLEEKQTEEKKKLEEKERLREHVTRKVSAVAASLAFIPGS